MNGGKLPEGWVETPLENIVEILGDATNLLI